MFGLNKRTALCVVWFATVVVAQPATAKTIVLLASEAPGIPAGTALESGIGAKLRQDMLDPVRLYVELIDVTRTDDEAYDRAFGAYVRAKYSAAAPDLIITLAQPALDFALRHRAEIFTNVPLLFGLVDEVSIRNRALGPDVTGVFIRPPAPDTLDLALRLQPRVRRVIVVSGTTPLDRSWEAGVRLAARAFEPRVSFTFLTDRRLRDLLGALTLLEDDAIVLYASLSMDGDGVPATSSEVAEMVRRASHVPVYGLASPYLGHGIVGGVLVDYTQHGVELAERAARLLSGDRASALPPATTANLAAFDARELQRFGIREALLPPGAIVQNREASLWQLHMWEIVVGTMLAAAGSLKLVHVAFGRRREKRRPARDLRERGVEPLALEEPASLAAAPANRGDVAPAWPDSTLHGAAPRLPPPHAAVVDRDGVIVSVNDAWMRFGLANGVRSLAAVSPGASYRDVCLKAVRDGVAGAADVLAGMDAVANGRSDTFEFEYPCGRPGRDQSCLMRVTPLRRNSGSVVVMHWNVTSLRRLETAVRDRGAEFRDVADTLSVAVWIAGPDGRATYFNTRWLEMTGRRMDEEVDLGWLEGVHPDDRAAAIDIRRQAFIERKTYSLVYRIRCADGAYRWLVERGIPRPDGTFRGYASLLDKGLIDTAEHHHAERMLRDLTGRVINAQEDERRRIARELHDNVNQQIALLSIEIEQLGLRPPESSSAVTARMRELAARTAHISSEIHNLSHRLHSSQLDALGLVAAVRAQCLEFASQGLDVDFVDKDVPPNVPENVALCLFRILQEALTNVAKHSGASQARVTLTGTGGAIVLRVIDAGRGFDPVDLRTPGLGLVSMRERLRMLDGVLTITSPPGLGTTIEALVPYTPPAGRPGDFRRSDVQPS